MSETHGSSPADRFAQEAVKQLREINGELALTQEAFHALCKKLETYPKRESALVDLVVMSRRLLAQKADRAAAHIAGLVVWLVGREQAKELMVGAGLDATQAKRLANQTELKPPSLSTGLAPPKPGGVGRKRR